MGQFDKCKKCGKRIMFVRMKSGKSMPVDPQFLNYRSGGKERIVTPGGEVVAGTITDDPANCDGYGYISHFATCEYSKMFGKKKKAQ